MVTRVMGKMDCLIARAEAPVRPRLEMDLRWTRFVASVLEGRRWDRTSERLGSSRLPSLPSLKGMLVALIGVAQGLWYPEMGWGMLGKGFVKREVLYDLWMDPEWNDRDRQRSQDSRRRRREVELADLDLHVSWRKFEATYEGLKLFRH